MEGTGEKDGGPEEEGEVGGASKMLKKPNKWDSQTCGEHTIDYCIKTETYYATFNHRPIPSITLFCVCASTHTPYTPLSPSAY